MTQQNRLFCFGLGYSCKALASALAGQGFAVAGTTRSEEKRQNLTAHGIDAYLFTGNAPLADAIKALSGITHLVISIPPSEAGDVVLNLHGDDVRA